jgi:hypothetical protein
MHVGRPDVELVRLGLDQRRATPLGKPKPIVVSSRENAT